MVPLNDQTINPVENILEGYKQIRTASLLFRQRANPIDTDNILSKLDHEGHLEIDPCYIYVNFIISLPRYEIQYSFLSVYI